MRAVTFTLLLGVIGLVGCSRDPGMRPEPVNVQGTVKLPGGASPKDLTVTFQPQQNTPPGGAKVGADGSFSVKLTPGKYSVYFQDEANAKVAAYQNVPAAYRQPSDEHTVTVSSGQQLSIEVK